MRSAAEAGRREHVAGKASGWEPEASGGLRSGRAKSKERNVYVMAVVRETCVLQRPLRDALWAAPCHCGGWEAHEDTAMSSRFAGQRTSDEPSFAPCVFLKPA